jgi:transcriptional regulator with XRE-family HTH domain
MTRKRRSRRDTPATRALAKILRILADTRPKPNIGRRVKALREARGMTQERLARRAKVSQGYIAKLEPSARPGVMKTAQMLNPSLAVVQRLAEALGVPVTKLFRW